MADGTRDPAFHAILVPHGTQGKWVLLPSFPSPPGQPAHDLIPAYLSPSHRSPRFQSPRPLEWEPRLRGLKEKPGHWGFAKLGEHHGP